MGWFLPLMKAVAPTVIGGVMQNRANKRAMQAQEQANSQQLQKLVADAEAAGFNPLTALRATGGQGYNITHGGMSNAQWVSDAIGAGLRAIDPMQRERDALEQRLLNAQVTAAERMANEMGADPRPRASAPLGRAPGPMTASVPTVQTVAPVLSYGNVNAATGDLLPMEPEVQMPTATNPWRTMVRDKDAVDAETGEAAYGELGGFMFGAYNLINDLGYNVRLGNTPIQREMTIIQQNGGFWQLPQFMRENNERNNSRMQSFGITTSP